MSGPLCYRVKATHSSELAIWMDFHQVKPTDMPYQSDVFVKSDDGEEWWIQYQAYRRSPGGTVLYDSKAATFRYETRTVPLAYDPPMWWLIEENETAPSG